MLRVFFFGSFEINFKLKKLKKVKPKLSLEDGLATVGVQYWHVGEIGFESQTWLLQQSCLRLLVVLFGAPTPVP